jgi:hypothetical protein
MNINAAGIVRKFVRYIVAIGIAIIVGQIAQVSAAVFIDVIRGHEVTPGRWTFYAANAIVILIQGAAVGSAAGAIAKKHGMLISGIAILLPLVIFGLLELIGNQTFYDYIATIYDTNPALWGWIALIPAMGCGHLFSKLAQQRQAKVSVLGT